MWGIISHRVENQPSQGVFSLSSQAISEPEIFKMDIFHEPLALEPRFASVPTFHYTRLDNASTDIRLLKIRKSADLKEIDTVQLDLYHAKLQGASSTPTYMALSYTWGRPSNKFPLQWDDKRYFFEVIVNGCKFSVRPNLFHALLEIRRHTNDSALWIDAICIDQSYVDEKNEQVAQMGEIYRRSSIALVWLGPADGFTDQAYNWMAHIAKSWERRKPRSVVIARDDSDELQAYAKAVQEEFFVKDAMESWRAVKTILTRIWFERAWVAQEICLAPRAILRCGHRSIPWTEVDDVTKMVLQHSGCLKLIKGREAEFRLLMDIYEGVWASIHLHNVLAHHDTWAHKRHASPPLCYVLNRLRFSDAEKLLDKVYAGFGLAKKSLGMEVNYENPARDVFMAALWYSNEMSDKLDMSFLGYCQYPPEQNELPTWVPDWSIRYLKCEPFPRRGLNAFMDPDAVPLYSAGGTPQSDKAPGIDAEPGVLMLWGTCWNEISFVSSSAGTVIPGPPGSTTSSGSSRKNSIIANAEWLHEWATDLKQRGDQYDNIDTLSWSYQPAAKGESQFEKLKYDITDEDLWEAYLNTLRVDVYQDERNRKEMRCRDWPAELGFQYGTYYVDGRSFACTNGGYICLVPEATRTGDFVAFCNHCDLPLVLRVAEDGKTFILIGECYVHGLMDGQAYNIRQEDDTCSWIPIT